MSIFVSVFFELMLIRPPKLLKRIYPSFIWNFPDEKDGVFLTFDDGPCPQVTPWVLDTLDKYNAKATFFCIGKNVELYPELFREIVRRGHAVGVHSYSHVPGWGMQADDYVQDVDLAADLIGSNLYRPPYAKITRKQAELVSRRYHIVMWDILSRDYNRKMGHKACARNVLRYLHPGAVVVFHDSMKASKNMWYALPLTLRRIQEMGLKCKPIVIEK